MKNYRLIREVFRSSDLGKLELNGVVRPYFYYGILYNYFPLAFLGNPYLKQFKACIRSLLKLNFSDN